VCNLRYYHSVRRRFFVDNFEGSRAILGGDTAHHLGHVLRAKAGQLYELSDGCSVRLARVENVTRDHIEFSLGEEIPSNQPLLDVTLLLSVVKFDAFEWAIEKATELGVTTIVPLASARSEKALLGAAPKRAARWAKILLESSQQSRRVCLPTLAALNRPSTAFLQYQGGMKVMLSERPQAPLLRNLLRDGRARSVVLAIGPEGGWTDDEFELGGGAGFQEGSLGKLILRTETAVVAALATLNCALEPPDR
jgi:16S rRNA (uracil1498-N3)-methyltransferase